MRLLPDGTVEIRNKSTGETKIIKPGELGNYGISNQDYLSELEASKKIETIQSGEPVPDPVAERAKVSSLKEQKGLAGDLKQFWESYQSVEGAAKGGLGVTEAQLPKFLGMSVDKGLGASLFPNASAFDAQRGSLAFSMASAIANQSGTKLSDKDVEVFQKALPGRSDSEESAKKKLDDTVEKLRRRMLDSGASEDEADNVINGITNAQEDSGTTLGSILKAGGQDIADIATGTKDILKTSAQGYKMLPELIQGVQRGDVSGEKVFEELGKAGLNLGGEVVKGTVQEYKNIATNPKEQLTQHPVNTLLALLPILQGVNKLKGVNQAGKVAKAAEVASNVDKALPDELASVLQPETVSSIANVGETGATANSMISNAPKLLDDAPKIDPQIKSILDKASKAGETEGVGQMARNVYQSVLNFSKKDRAFERLQPNKTVGSMIEYGVSGTPDEILTKTKTVTGKNGVLSNVVNEALVDTRVPATLEDLAPIHDLIQTSKNKSLYSKLTDKDFGTVTREINNLPQLQTGKIGEYDLSKLLDYERELQEAAQQHRIAGRLDIQSRQMGEFLGDVAREIGDVIDTKVGDVGSIEKYKDPDIIAALNDVSPKLAEEFIKAESLSEIRSLQAPFVRMQKIMDLVLQEPSSLGKNLFRGAAQIPVIGPILDTVAQSVAVPVATKTAVAMDKGVQNPLIQTLLNMRR